MLKNWRFLQERFNALYDGEFLTIHIVQRSKDGHQIKGSGKIVKTYTIQKSDDYKEISARIEQSCEKYNARAYMNVNINDINQVKMKMINILSSTELAQKPIKQLLKMKGVFNSSTSQTRSSRHHKLWIIDIDYSDKFPRSQVKQFITQLNEIYTTLKSYDGGASMKVQYVVPSPNGCHVLIPSGEIVTKLYNFLQEYGMGKADVKKDDMSVIHWID